MFSEFFGHYVHSRKRFDRELRAEVGDGMRE